MEYDEKVDVFSFGIVLCEIITRRKVTTDLQRAPQDAFCLDPEKFTPLVPEDCPPAFLRLALSCCEYESEKRPTFIDIIGMEP